MYLFLVPIAVYVTEESSKEMKLFTQILVDFRSQNRKHEDTPRHNKNSIRIGGEKFLWCRGYTGDFWYIKYESAWADEVIYEFKNSRYTLKLV